MKLSHALRKLVSWISVIALLMSLLAVSVALPVAATTNYSNYYATLADFTDSVPTSYSNSNCTTTIEAVSPSGYGAGLAWTRADSATTYQNVVMNFSAASPATTAEDTAVAFWISMKESGYDYTVKLRTFLRSRTSTTSSENCYRPIVGAAFYTVLDGVCEERTVTDSQSLTLPGGFEGWVVLPYTSCETHWSGNTQDTVSPDYISALDLYISNMYVTGVVHIDEVGVTTDYMNFLEDVGDFPLITADIHALESTAGVTAENGMLSSSTANAQSGNALQMTTTASTEVRIANQLTDSAALAKLNTLSLWVATGDTAVQLVPSLNLGDAVAALEISDLRRDFYRLVDGAEDVSAAYPYQNGTVTVPAGFSGYLVMDIASFAGGKTGSLDLSALTEVMLTVQGAATVTLDTVQASVGAAAFIETTLGKTMDTDLLQVQDATKVSLSGKTFTLLQENMTSTQLCSAIAVRRGYRAVYRDSGNRQLFGLLADADEIAVIEVYLGGRRMATYTNTELPMEQPDTSTSSGGNISLSDYNIAVDFDEKMYTTLAHEGGGGAAPVSAGSPYGQALKWERGTAAEGTSQSVFAMYFTPSRYTDEQALVFWVSASVHASTNIPMYVYGQTTAGSSGVTRMAAGAAYQTLSGDGTVTNVTAPSDSCIRVEKDFEGWYIIPLSSLTNADNTLAVAPGTVNGLYMHTSATYGNALIIDQVGFTHDTANFITKAIAGTLNDTVLTLEDIYHVGVDFDDTMYTGLTPSGGGAQTVVSCESPYGQALQWERGTTGSSSIFEMSYTPTGQEKDTALVFWADGEDIVADMTMSVMVYDTGGSNGATRCFKIPSGGAYQTLSVDGVLTEATAPSDQVIRLSKGFVGWYIIPYSTFAEHWGGEDTDTVAADLIFRVRFATSSNYGNVIYLDELGSAVDTATFITLAMAALEDYTADHHDWTAATCTTPVTCTLCGAMEGESLGHTWVAATCTDPKTCSVCDATEGEALGHTWVDATCTEFQVCSVCQTTGDEALGHNWVDGICSRCETAMPLADLYHAVINFDTQSYTNSSTPHSGGGSISEVNCVSPYGEALKWERGTAAEGASSTALNLQVITTSDTTETALVLWVDGSEMLANAGTTLLLYDTSGSRCFKMGVGNAYQTVSMDGTVTDEVSTADQCITLKKDFVGWYVIPLTSFVPHWSGTTGSVAAGNVNKIYLAHSSNYGTVVYIDEIGFTSNMAAFRNVAVVESVAWEGVQHDWEGTVCTKCGAAKENPDSE